MQKQAADAGLAPQVHAVCEMGDDVVVVMDAIDTDRWYNADAMDDVAPTLLGELNDEEMRQGVTLYCRLLLAGVVHADLHSANWYMNDEGETIAIDFGISSTIGTASLTHLNRAAQFLVPCLNRLDMISEEHQLRAAYGDADELRNALQETALAVLA